MKSMLEYIEAASDLLGSLWGDAKAAEIRTYLKKHHSDWTPEEHEELLTLCATLANWQAEGAFDAAWEAEKRGREIHETARRTGKGLAKFKVRERNKREDEHRASIIERHFGAALRGEMPKEDDA